MQNQLESNEYYRVSSYWWIGKIYIALETKGGGGKNAMSGKKAVKKLLNGF
jgi:hypothetical protein